LSLLDLEVFLRQDLLSIAAGDDTQQVFKSVTQMVDHLQRNEYIGSSGQKVAFVFGREVAGLTAAEVAACSSVCTIPMGRLQESLSLSHAVAIALCAIFESTAPDAGNYCV